MILWTLSLGLNIESNLIHNLSALQFVKVSLSHCELRYLSIKLKIKWYLTREWRFWKYGLVDWLIDYYHHKQRLWSLRLSVSLNTSFTTSFATFFTMVLAAIYNTPAVPNQNSVSSGFILYQLWSVVIILKAYTVYLRGCVPFSRSMT
jgi:hypothetical protein